MDYSAETEHADTPTFEAARYGASQALMHLQLAEPFARVTWTASHDCEIEVDPQSSTPGNRARVSLAGLACFLMGRSSNCRTNLRRVGSALSAASSADGWSKSRTAMAGTSLL